MSFQNAILFIHDRRDMQILVRIDAANDATLASLSADARARAAGSRANDLVRRIRDFFGL